MHLNVRMDLSGITKKFDALGRDQVPYAAAQAINAVTWAVKSKSGPAEMGKVFDSPTPWTLKSLRTTRADKRNVLGTVGWSDQTSAGRQLVQEITGGTRARKALEKFLSGMGLISASEMVVPGMGVPRDAYGNIARSKIQQIVAELSAGPAPSRRPRGKRLGDRQGRIFWSFGPGVGRQHLPRGAWQVIDERTVKPLLRVVSSANYKSRFDLARVVQEEKARTFGPAFKEALARATKQ